MGGDGRLLTLLYTEALVRNTCIFCVACLCNTRRHLCNDARRILQRTLSIPPAAFSFFSDISFLLLCHSSHVPVDLARLVSVKRRGRLAL